MTDINHDLALDLAADALDFELSPTEQRNLDDHLASCGDCEYEARLLKEDDSWLENGFDWRSYDEQDDGDDDEFGPRFEPPDDEDEDDRVTAVDATDVDELPRGAGQAEDEDEDNLLLGDHKLEKPGEDGDDDDDEAAGDELSDLDRGAAPSEDQLEAPTSIEELNEILEDAGYEKVEPDEDDDDLDDEDVGITTRRDGDGEADDRDAEADDDRDEDEPRTGNEPARGDALHDGQDPIKVEPDFDDLDSEDSTRDMTPEELMRQAQDLADAFSDDDLGGVESERMSDDDVLEDVTDLVDDAAAEHGAPDSFSDLHARAERIVRNRDGLVRTDFGTVAVYRSTKGLKHRRNSDDYAGGNVSSPAASAAVRNAILRSRLGRAGVERRQPRGRLDNTSLARIAEHDKRLFKRMIVPSPGKFLVWVMVDVSGSMQGYPIRDACQVAKALADASSGAPTVRLSVWGWSDPFIRNESSWSASAGVVKVWEKGKSPSTESIWDLRLLNMGGTPDAAVLAWAWREILKHTLPGEHPVIIMASDGWGDHRFPNVIDQARKHGVAMKNVALGRYVHEADQKERFGRGNYVPWRGSISATAQPLSAMIAKMAAGE